MKVLYVPGTQSVQFADRAGDHTPIWQDEQVELLVAPREGEKYPARQEVQLEDGPDNCGVDDQLPEGQSVQLLEPTPEKVPGTQGRQTNEGSMNSWVANTDEETQVAFPAGQAEQVASPIEKA